MEKETQSFTNEKKDLLFLHGYLSSSKSFVFQTKFFKDYYNVYAPDLKGFGSNQGMDTPYSLDDYIKDVKEYIKDNNIRSPDVIAHSFGGRIAIKIMATEPTLFNRVVLTGAAGLKPKFSIQKFVKKATFKTLKKFVKKEKLLSFYSSDYLSLTQVMRESFIKIVNEHLDDRLKSIQNQTLIIAGADDFETPVYMQKRLNRGIVNSRLILIKDTGHFCFIDKPLKFNMEVREFLLS